MENSNYARELVSRQNRSLTSAQKDMLLNVKRYYDKDIKEAILVIKSLKQKDLDGKELKTDSTFGVPTRILDKVNCSDIKEKEIDSSKDETDLNQVVPIKILNNDVNKQEIIVECVDGKLRVFKYNSKVIMVDEQGNNVKIKHREDLFDNLIYELQKIYEWLDYRAASMKFIDKDNENTEITTDEIKVVINFFKKLNNMKDD